VTTRYDSISLSELFAYLLSQESCIESRQTTPKTDEYSANFVNRGRGRAPMRGRGRGGRFSPAGRGNNGNFSSSGNSGGSSGKKSPCQTHALFMECHVPIPISRMGLQKENIGT
jgi:hypothetical protein